MPNRRHNSRRFTPSCPNSTTNSCRCDMIDFSDHGIPASPPQAKDADSMCQPCLRTPVHYLPGLYSGEREGPADPRITSGEEGEGQPGTAPGERTVTVVDAALRLDRW